MLVTIRLFARLREIAGSGELQQELPAGATARTAWDALAARHPELEPYGTVASCAVNEEYARFSTPLSDGDEVAFLPPVSGGCSAAEHLTRDRGLTTGRPATDDWMYVR